MKLITNFLFALAVLSAITNSMQRSRRPLPTEVTLGRRTEAKDWGKNNIFFLDRQHVNCNQGEALQGFHLVRPTPEQLAYEFTCKHLGEDKRVAYEDKTPWNDVGGTHEKSANYLDRHYPQCKEGYAIQNFRMGRNGDKINYIYTCVRVKCGPTQTKQTDQTPDGGFETIYLDRQTVKVMSDEVITGFKLNNSGGKNNYTINFCQLEWGKPIEPIRPPPGVLPLPTPPKPEPLPVGPFCIRACKPNDMGKKSKCYLNGQFSPCKRCISNGTEKDPQTSNLCGVFCNSINNGPCDLFGYRNNQKKQVDPVLLKKSGLSLAKLRRLLRRFF